MKKFLKHVLGFLHSLLNGVTKEDLKEHLNNLPELSYPLVSRYSGWGGGDEGAHQSGFFTMFATDLDKHAVESFRMNHLTTPIYKADATKMTAEETLQLARIPESKAFGYLGSASCKGVSIAGSFDPFNIQNLMLLNEPFFISQLRPTFFVIENVSSIGKGRMKVLKFMFARQVENWLGDYEIREIVMDSADFSVPQHRHRYLLVGFLKSTGIVPQFPESVGKVLTIEDVLPGVDGIRSGYNAKNFRPKSRPCPTLTATENLWKQVGGVISRLEVDEILKLCGYPEKWRTTGTRRKVYERAGNSIMPPFAKAIFAQIYKQLQDAGIEPCETEELLSITVETVPLSIEWQQEEKLKKDSDSLAA